MAGIGRKRRRVSEGRLERRLVEALSTALMGTGGDAASFEEAGILTTNKGIVLSLGNGQQFQLTIVESTRR